MYQDTLGHLIVFALQIAGIFAAVFYAWFVLFLLGYGIVRLGERCSVMGKLIAYSVSRLLKR